ncbi:MAG: glycosyltransferase family 39 protein [Rhodospirillales bacterium]|nr:glycosyltransferase family 39 protein [Rhodospirillales bacterium]
MTALAVLLLQTISCVGFGATVLRLLRVDQTLQWQQRVSWSFVLGIGVLGWALFFLGIAGLYSPVAMFVLLVVGVPGVIFLGRPESRARDTWAWFEWVILAALLVALGLDCLEALSPPTDADTLAYHFATPKQFLQEGRIFFIPRAVDGAAPLLLQMTYGSALGLGDESAMTQWAMVSGWGAALMLYVLAASYMNRAWALTITLIWLTAPVVLYGGGTGQVEVRNAGFVLLAIAALMKGHEKGWLRYAALAGLAIGFFIASKYTGLLAAVAVVAGLLFLRRWPVQVLVFGAMAVLAGSQWYVWNFIHTGDPVFPMLFSLLGGPDYPYWDAAHNQALHDSLFQGERAIPNTPLWMLVYPFLATFATEVAFDSERAGMGPFLLLILPFAIAGYWRYRRNITNSPWLVALVVLTLFYLFWFLSGSSQRVRHLVPVYPVALLVCTYLAVRWSKSAKTAWPLYVATLLTLVIQMAGHGASSLNYARYLFLGETRDAYYERNISGYAAVKWINDNLSSGKKVMFRNRELNYLIDAPSFYAHPSNEVLVDIRHDAENAQLYFRQLQNLGVTHILTLNIQNDRPTTQEESLGGGQWRALFDAGCVKVDASVPYRPILSRSLNITSPIKGRQLILKIVTSTCSTE